MTGNLRMQAVNAGSYKRTYAVVRGASLDAVLFQKLLVEHQNFPPSPSHTMGLSIFLAVRLLLMACA